MSATAPEARSLQKFLSLEPLDNRYPQLHGLRVIAILSVVQFHVTWIFAGEQAMVFDSELVATSLSIFFGMDLFFILSGFLIGSILLRSLETAGTQNLKRFYVRRVSRTFPSYYVVLTYLALTTVLSATQKSHLVYEYIYATNLVSLRRPNILMFWGWSLALEEQFYITVPLLFVVLQKLRSDRARITLLALLWISALVIRLVIFHSRASWKDIELYEVLYFHPYTRFDTLVCGIGLAFVHARYKDSITAWLTDPLHRAMLALPALACLWILVAPWMFGVEHVQLVHVFAWGTITSIMYFLGLVLFLHTEGVLQRSLSKPIFRRIATLGYGVYLVHIPVCDRLVVPIARALDARHVPMGLVWPVCLVLLMLFALAIGYVLHVIVEKPALRLRERIAG